LEVTSILNQLGLYKTNTEKVFEESENKPHRQFDLDVQYPGDAASEPTDPLTQIFADDFVFDIKNICLSKWTRERAELMGVSLKRNIFNLNRNRIMGEIESCVKNSAFPHITLTEKGSVSIDAADSCKTDHISSKTSIKKWSTAYTKEKNKFSRRTEEKRMGENFSKSTFVDYDQEQQTVLYQEFEDKYCNDEEYDDR